MHTAPRVLANVLATIYGSIRPFRRELAVCEVRVRRKRFGGLWWRHIPRSTNVARLSNPGQPDSSDAHLCGELPARWRSIMGELPVRFMYLAHSSVRPCCWPTGRDYPQRKSPNGSQSGSGLPKAGSAMGTSNFAAKWKTYNSGAARNAEHWCRRAAPVSSAPQRPKRSCYCRHSSEPRLLRSHSALLDS
jgi:hypothetical protein